VAKRPDKEQLREAIDSALKIHVEKLFDVLTMSTLAAPEDADTHFANGLRNVVRCYGAAHDTVDRL
jgi:hypothetical protein